MLEWSRARTSFGNANMVMLYIYALRSGNSYSYDEIRIIFLNDSLIGIVL